MSYYVSVDGGRAPQHQHESKFAAVAEARRLSELPENRSRAVRVFKEVGGFIPVQITSHVWKAEQE
jgi:hypothetical protein